MDLFSTANESVDDGSATVDPTALLPAGSANPSITVPPNDNPSRGKKRGFGTTTGDDIGQSEITTLHGVLDDDEQPRKRGRATLKGRTSGVNVDTSKQSNMAQPLKSQPQTPQQLSIGLPPQATPATSTQSSTPKTTPKSSIKALPTVRDHTTDQLGSDGDEYLAREFDEAGEKKVNSTGHLADNREYKCRTFLVPNRGNKLFMLATECARVLNYRDSYLLFNKNRSLYKIIASQIEKEDLIHQEILPFSYRSRQIAIVTAKSMFRQFGSRVINNGRRVRDDYWEAKAIKQGFTEDDLAGDKRPGAAKAREASAAEAANNSAIISNQADIIYSNAPVHFGNNYSQLHGGIMTGPGALGASPTINDQGDLQAGVADYTSISRPRQELTGLPYQDRSHATSMNDMIVQAQQAADFNKQVNQQRTMREQFMTEVWHKPHEQPPNSGGLLVATEDEAPLANPSMMSPRTTGNLIQPMMAPNQSQHPMTAQPYINSNQHNAMDQSPMRAMAQPMNRPDHMTSRSPSLSLSSGAMGHNAVNYGYGQSQMWPPPQPQQSPQHAYASYPQLSPQIHPSHQQSHGHQQSPGIRHPSNNAQMQPMQYPNMHGMPQYNPSGRPMYPGDNRPYMPSNVPPGSSGQNWPDNQQQQPPPSSNWNWQG